MKSEMAGKVVLLTGGTHGIGLVVATKMAMLGAKLYLVCPDRTASEISDARAVVTNLIKLTANSDINIIFGDLSSLAAVRRVAQEFIGTGNALDILINNAGVYGVRKETRTVDGHELHFGLNYLAYFALTILLLERLKMSASARVINVASDAYARSGFEVDRYKRYETYDFRDRYAFSKLCVVLFTRKISQVLSKENITVNCLHPGLVHTGIAKNAGLFFNLMLRVMGRKYAQSPEDAAKTYLYLANSADVEGVSGKYFYNEVEQPINEIARDDDKANELWNLSLEITNLKPIVDVALSTENNVKYSIVRR